MPKSAGLLVCLLIVSLPQSVGAQSALDAIEREGAERIGEGQSAQARIDDISQRNRSLEDDYLAELKIVQGLETYVGLLDMQLDGQRDEMEVLQRSITDVAVIERQILPLMLRMVDSLEKFVELDVPFLVQERRSRIDKMRAMLGRSDVTVAEKSRRVFEAYQIENEYGRTIERYTAKLDLEGASYDAEFLRIGRLGLLYTTVGSGLVGFWDNRTRSWQPLESTPWSRMLEQGFKVAGQEVAPQLIHVPLDPTQEELL